MKVFELDIDRALLMVIDIQERLVPAMGRGQEVIRQTAVLLETADHLGIPAVFTEQYRKGLGETTRDLGNWQAKAETFEKTTFSACTEAVMAALNTKGRRQIVITGMETHVCVFQTVRGLLKAGYEVFVVEDAVCSRTEANYLNGLALMQEMGAVITNTETVFFDLLKEANTDQFRELRRLIK